MNYETEIVLIVIFALILSMVGLSAMSYWGMSERAKEDQVNLEKMGYNATYHGLFNGHDDALCTVKVKNGDVPCDYVVGAKIID